MRAQTQTRAFDYTFRYTSGGTSGTSRRGGALSLYHATKFKWLRKAASLRKEQETKHKCKRTYEREKNSKFN